jgi:hypothetical protein
MRVLSVILSGILVSGSCFTGLALAKSESQGETASKESDLVTVARVMVDVAKQSADPVKIRAAEDKLREEMVKDNVKRQALKEAVKPSKLHKAGEIEKEVVETKGAGFKSDDIIQADRKALRAAQGTGDPAKVKLAQDQLNKDLKTVEAERLKLEKEQSGTGQEKPVDVIKKAAPMKEKLEKKKTWTYVDPKGK